MQLPKHVLPASTTGSVESWKGPGNVNPRKQKDEAAMFEHSVGGAEEHMCKSGHWTSHEGLTCFRGLPGQAVEMPSGDKELEKGRSSETNYVAIYLVNGYGGSSGYPEVASMAPGYCQARHCQAHGKTPLAARSA